MNISTDGALHFAGKSGETVIGFATILYVAHELGPSAVGAYALAVAVATWATLPINAIASAISKRTSEDGDGGYILAGWSVSAVVLLAVIGVMTPFAGFIEGYTGVGFPLVAGLIAALSVYPLSANAFVGREMVGHNGLINTADRGIRLIATVALVVSGWGIAAVVAGHILGVVVAWVGAPAVYWTRLDVGLPESEHVGDLFTYAKHIWLDVLRTKAFTWTDTLVLGFFVSPTLIGIYEVAWRLASAVSLVANSVQSAVFPRISATDGDGLERANRILEDSLSYPGIFAIPAILGALVLGESVLLIYGADFAVAGSGTVLILLLTASFLGAYGKQFIGALNAVDRHGDAFRINALVIGANLLLNTVLVWRYGWVGAAVATLVAYAIALVLGHEDLESVVGRIEPPVRDLTHQVSAALLMAVVVAVLSAFKPVNTVPWLLTVVGVGAAVYCVAMLAINPTVRGTAESVLGDIEYGRPQQ